MSTQSKLQPVEAAELMAIEGGHHHYYPHHASGGGLLGGLAGLLGSLGHGTVNIFLNITNNIAVIAGNILGGGATIAVGQQGGQPGA